jgi:hypothetical protein
MIVEMRGFLSCVCVARNIEDLEKISDFAKVLRSMFQQFEIIACVTSKLIEERDIEQYCDETPSLAVYEISTPSIDTQFSAGLELALGDWILELPDISSLERDTQDLLKSFSLDIYSEADSYQLIPSKRPLLDRFMCIFASAALEVPVHTMLHMPRLTKRSALQTWNARKLRVKVLRVAPQIGRANVIYQVKAKSYSDTKRFFRISLRTLVHSSAKPLRWVSSFSLFGAFTSVIISISILLVGIKSNVVPGWTTTNLQISTLSFLILLVLGILAEYIYQIVASSIDQPTFRIVHEYMSPRYNFRTNMNISQPGQSRTNSIE